MLIIRFSLYLIILIPLHMFLSDDFCEMEKKKKLVILSDDEVDIFLIIGRNFVLMFV